MRARGSWGYYLALRTTQEPSGGAQWVMTGGGSEAMCKPWAWVSLAVSERVCSLGVGDWGGVVAWVFLAPSAWMGCEKVDDELRAERVGM